MLRINPTLLVFSQQVLSLLLLLAPSIGYAASPVESLAVTAKISEGGQVSVEQTITYITPSQIDWDIFSTANNLVIQKDGQPASKKEINTRRTSAKTAITSSSYATVWKISYQAPGSLIRHNNRDQLFLKIFDQPERPVYQLEVKFLLPESAGNKTNLSGNIYSISGVVDPTTTLVSTRELRFATSYAGPDSLVTISATWNKEVISLTAIDQAKLSLGQLDAAPWLAFGLLLPLASVIVFLRLLWRQKRQEKDCQEIINKPPLATSAILAGVLVRKKVYAPQIAALLIDLCQRGYLIIVKRAGKYFIAKRKPLDEHVESWEREIIEEMFFRRGNTFSEDQLHDLGSTRLYSPSVRSAFRKIYEVITNQAYFIENPHFTRVRHKLLALFLYYASAAGVIWVAVSNNSPYLILPLAGTMVVAILIIKFTPRLAAYSDKGVEARKKWLAFANYLKTNKPLPFEVSRNHTFDKFLPYAVALDVTLQWARRFDLSSITLIKPDWFVSYEENTTVEFAKEIAGFTNQISEGITSLRGPLVS